MQSKLFHNLLINTLWNVSIPGTFNAYSLQNAKDRGEKPALVQLRRQRLIEHVTTHINAPYVLVGEAFGYRGARFSGVPMTSEWQLTGSGSHERTAQVVHDVLDELGVGHMVMLWNVCMLHPYMKQDLTRNRTPRSHEIDACSPVLHEVIRGRIVIPMGAVAARIVGGQAVRHPAHGGAALFRSGMRNILLKPS